MFSEWKQIAYDVKDGIAKQKKLVILYLIWSIICIYWGIWNSCSIYGFYQIEISAADLLIFQQNYWKFGIMIFPAAIFIVMKCKQDSVNVQFILRYGSRKKMLRRQVMESVVYAVCITVILLAVETIISMLINGRFINWNSVDSFYYNQTGTVISEHYVVVLLGIGLMYFIKFMMAFVMLDILLWHRKYIFLLWIVIVLLAGSESVEIPVFYQLFAISHSLWQLPWKHIVLVLSGGAFVILEYFVGSLLIKKKDIYQ